MFLHIKINAFRIGMIFIMYLPRTTDAEQHEESAATARELQNEAITTFDMSSGKPRKRKS